MFYTLVSEDTKEQSYVVKRQSFLAEQGYVFDVQRDIVPAEEPLMFASIQERFALLRNIFEVKAPRNAVKTKKRKKSELARALEDQDRMLKQRKRKRKPAVLEAVMD